MHNRSCRRFALISLLIYTISAASYASSEDWPKFLRDLNNSANSAETGIDSSNVSTLRAKWVFSTGYEVSASPAVATIKGESILYLGSWDGTFHALNAVTGQKIWSFTIDIIPPCTTNSCRIGSSAAVDVANNLVFFGTMNAYLYALNATTGALVWKQQLGDPTKGAEVWSSPVFYNGMVFVGLASHTDSPCIIGLVNAYHELSGNPVWSFSTIDQNSCSSGTCVGGAVWSSLAIDATNGIVYAGTGNPGASCTPPTQNATRYPDAVLALDAANGTLLNYYLAVANDTQDNDFGTSPMLHMSGKTNQCTGHNTIAYWVSDMNKAGGIFTLGRNANGLTGTRQKLQGPSGSIASGAFREQTVTTQCSTGKQLVQYSNNIFVPNQAGDLLTLFQSYTGKVSLKATTKVSQKANYSAPAVIKDIVLFGSNDGHVYVTNTNGTKLTSFTVKGGVFGGIAISNNRIYYGSSQGYIYCMSPNGM